MFHCAPVSSSDTAQTDQHSAAGKYLRPQIFYYHKYFNIENILLEKDFLLSNVEPVGDFVVRECLLLPGNSDKN